MDLQEKYVFTATFRFYSGICGLRTIICIGASQIIMVADEESPL